MTDLPLANRSIILASPCMDGKYDRSYVRSFYGTLKGLEELGAKIDFVDLPGCSDLPMARAKLFSYFLKSSHTDMFLADTDMGWDPKDVIRLALLNRDFIAGMGPKKKLPLEFCFNNQNDDGTQCPITFEAETGVMDVTEVGMAFVMINKNCASRMADYYNNECGVDQPDGDTIYYVFDPIRLSRTRRLAEDYAFCHRWRKIGGKVQVLPDITLAHTGTQVWQGSFAEEAKRLMSKEVKYEQAAE